MADGNRQRWGVGFCVAVLLAGMLAGSVMLTPVGAHITTFKHLKTKHFYTKKAADSRFINVGEKASSAATADTAANADKLDGIDSTGFAQTSSVLFAVVDEAGTLVDGRGVTSVTKYPAEGNYGVFFNRNVSDCAAVVTTGGYPTGPATNTGFYIGLAHARVSGTGPGFNNEVGGAHLATGPPAHQPPFSSRRRVLRTSNSCEVTSSEG
jgi:hypothetical protein